VSGRGSAEEEKGVLVIGEKGSKKKSVGKRKTSRKENAVHKEKKNFPYSGGGGEGEEFLLLRKGIIWQSKGERGPLIFSGKEGVGSFSPEGSEDVGLEGRTARLVAERGGEGGYLLVPY